MGAGTCLVATAVVLATCETNAADANAAADRAFARWTRRAIDCGIERCSLVHTVVYICPIIKRHTHITACSEQVGLESNIALWFRTADYSAILVAAHTSSIFNQHFFWRGRRHVELISRFTRGACYNIEEVPDQFNRRRHTSAHKLG
jgi:hypothetical protein